MRTIDNRVYHPLPPSALVTLFTKVLEIADLVVKELDLFDTEAVLLTTELALNTFCHGPGGGTTRLKAITQGGHYERVVRRRLPNLPRLLMWECSERLNC